VQTPVPKGKVVVEVQEALAMYFNTKYPSLQLKQLIISAWLKDEAKWHQQWENNKGDHSAKRA